MSDDVQRYIHGAAEAGLIEGERKLDIDTLLEERRKEREAAERRAARTRHRAFKGIAGSPTRKQRGL